MSFIPELTLDPAFEITQKSVQAIFETELGDGYINSSPKFPYPEETWEVSRVGLTTAEINTLVGNLKNWSGVKGFYWKPSPEEPKRVFTCDNWQTSLIAPNLWSFQATFKVDPGSESFDYKDLLDNNQLTLMLAGARSFLITYTKNVEPYLINTNNLICHSIHPRIGSLFPPGYANARDAAIACNACLRAYEATDIEDWLTRARNYALAAINNFYNTTPTPGSVWFPNNFINVKSTALTKTFQNAELVVSFTSGVGTIPSGSPHFGERLAEVFRVYTPSSKLLHKVPRSPLLAGGTEHTVDYWVSQPFMSGPNLRLRNDSNYFDRAAVTTTSEPVGRIQLTTNFTGNLLVSYSIYSTTALPVNTKFSNYRILEPLPSSGSSVSNYQTQALFYEAYKKLAQLVPGQPEFANARNLTRDNIINSSNLANRTDWNVASTNPELFFYPGIEVTQENVINNGTGITLSRQGTFFRLQLNYASAAYNIDSRFRTKIRNSAVFGDFDSLTNQIVVNFRGVNGNIYSFNFYDTPNKNDHANSFTFLALGTGADLTRTLTNSSIINYNSDTVHWYPVLQGFQVLTTPNLSGQDPATSTTLSEEIVAGDRYVYRRFTNEPLRETQSVIYVLPYKSTSGKPPRVFWRANQGTIDFIVRDGTTRTVGSSTEDVFFTARRTANNVWQKTQFTWTDFVGRDSNNLPISPRGGTGYIPELRIRVYSATNLDIIWVADAEPSVLEAGTRIDFFDIESQSQTTDDFALGECFLNVDKLSKRPSILANSVVVESNTIREYQGNPSIHSQIPHLWSEFGFNDRRNNSLNFLAESAAAYTAQHPNQLTGYLAPFYIWQYWRNGEFTLDSFEKYTWQSTDLDPFSAEHFYYALVNLAKLAYEVPTAVRARNLAFTAIGAIDTLYENTDNYDPITTIRPTVNPTRAYKNPAFAALVMKAAIYLNLAKMDRNVTYRVIKRSYDFLVSEYLSTGTMAGSFSASQPSVTVNSVSVREYYSQWHFECIDAIAMLRVFKDELFYPSDLVNILI